MGFHYCPGGLYTAHITNLCYPFNLFLGSSSLLAGLSLVIFIRPQLCIPIHLDELALSDWPKTRNEALFIYLFNCSSPTDFICGPILTNDTSNDAEFYLVVPSPSSIF